MITGIYKPNEVQTIGGTNPQGENVNLSGEIKGWQVVEVDESQISALQEFNIQPVYDGFVEAITGPQQEGAYNAPAYEIGGTGDKMRFELNPGQTSDGIEGVEPGIVLTSPDEMDDKKQQNFTSEDVVPYKDAYQFIKKYDAKSVLRNQIRGQVKDVEDDIADTKVAIQMAMYYMAYEWDSRTDAQKSANPNKVKMDTLTAKLLSDETKMRADLTNGIDKINEIISGEDQINAIVTENYKYNDDRGV